MKLIESGFEKIVRDTSLKSFDRGGSELNSLYWQEMQK
jgi:hypothetical protein